MQIYCDLFNLFISANVLLFISDSQKQQNLQQKHSVYHEILTVQHDILKVLTGVHQR